MTVALNAGSVPEKKIPSNEFPTKANEPSLVQFLPKEKQVPLGFWNTCKSKWHHLDQNIFHAIKSLEQLTSPDIQQQWSQIKIVLLKVLKTADSKTGSVLGKELSGILQKLNPEMLDQLMQDLIKQALQTDNMQAAEVVLKLMRLEQVESLMKVKHPQAESLESVIQAMNTVVPLEPISVIGKAVEAEVNQTMTYIVSFIPNLINTFLSAFRLFDLGKEPENAWEANGMLEVYFKLFAIPTAIVVAVGAIFNVSWQAWTISAAIILASIILVYAYIRWLKPCPEKLASCNNLTLDAKFGEVRDVVGRNKEINFLLEHYAKSTGKEARHIILVGPSGVGKTDIINGLANRIVSGNIPKEMKNKKIFTINTAQFSQKGLYGYADKIEMIFQRLKNYEKEVILFFDEIHAAMKTEGLADFLKPYLDHGTIQIIAATTLKEYNKYFVGTKEKPGDEAFTRRFQKMTVEQLSQAHVKKILFDELKDHDDVLFDIDAVDKIYEITENGELSGCQPSKSKHLLKAAAGKVREQSANSAVQNKLKAKQAELENLQTSCVETNTSLHPLDPKTSALYEQIGKVQQQVKKLEKEAAEQKQKLQQTHRLLKYRRTTRERIYKIVREFNNEKKDEAQLKSFVMNLEYVLPLLESLIKDCEQSLTDKVPIRVAKKMVETVFNEMYKK